VNIELVLPYPPSNNRYYRHARGRHYISAEGETYRGKVLAQAQGARLGAARLAVEITVHPPDRRRRDLDNTLKALLDALAHAGVYDNDEQIDMLHVRRSEVIKGGIVRVLVEAIT
jgi:crossover junction endodeoxyribonuclease RusA